MSVLISTTVSGITGPVIVEGEYSSTTIGNLYQTPITAIAQVFASLGIPTTSNPNLHTPTAADATTIFNNLNTLLQLAQNGIADPNGVSVQIPDPNNPGNTITVKKSFLTLNMAQQLDALNKSLQSVGFQNAYQSFLNTGDSTAVVNSLEQWANLGPEGLNSIVQSAVNAVNNNRSLQSMVELEYVKAGNDVISNALTGLNTALTATQNALNTLQAVENLHNQVNVQAINTMSINNFANGTLTGQFSSTGAYIQAYQNIANPLFNNPLAIVPDGDTATAINPIDPNTGQIIGANGGDEPLTAAQLVSYQQLQSQLSQEIAQLDQIAGVTAATRDPNSLAAKLQSVLTDMQGNNIVTWLQDNLSNVNNASAGNIEAHIQNAITQGESLNDQQKQAVQQQLFIFQEFYQSASSILTTITQVIAQIAQNIKAG